MEDFEYSGLWWLPDRPERTVGGTLRFSVEDGARLELLGTLSDDVRPVPEGLRRYPIIWGLVRGGDSITLHDCFTTRITSPSLDHVFQECRVMAAAYVGGHVEDPGALRFRHCEVRYTYLADWVSQIGFESRSAPPGGTSTFGLSYDHPPEFTAETPDGTLTVTYELVADFQRRSSVTLRQETLLRIDVAEPLALDSLQERFIQPLQNLLTLATARPNAVTGLTVYLPEARPNGDRDRPLEVAYEPIYVGTGPTDRLAPHQLLFTLRDASVQFDQIVARWLQLSRELASAVNLYFGALYRPAPYLDARFLNVMHAIEAFHRLGHTTDGGAARAHEQNVDRILLQITDATDRDWLAKELKFSAEPSLRQRLKQLLQTPEWKQVLWPLVGDTSGQWSTFVTRTLDSRNYYTHHDPTLREKAATRGRLLQITDTLSILMQLCLLRELGFPAERVATMFTNHRLYRQAKEMRKQLEDR